jgi:hypothetical protein
MGLNVVDALKINEFMTRIDVLIDVVNCYLILHVSGRCIYSIMNYEYCRLRTFIERAAAAAEQHIETKFNERASHACVSGVEKKQRESGLWWKNTSWKKYSRKMDVNKIFSAVFN